MSEHKIKMVLRKEQKWGRDLFYPVNRDDVWILGLLRQKSMTRENINFLKMTLPILVLIKNIGDLQSKD